MKQRLKAWGNTQIVNIVGAFVFNEEGELLLLQRHPEDLGGGKWGTPGGRIDPGETAEEAIKREFREETGIKSVVFKQLGSHEIHMPHGAVYMISYQATIPKKSQITLDLDEHQGYRWFKINGLRHTDKILWGIPSILRDFGIVDNFHADLTLIDGSSVKLIELAK